MNRTTIAIILIVVTLYREEIRQWISDFVKNQPTNTTTEKQQPLTQQQITEKIKQYLTTNTDQAALHRENLDASKPATAGAIDYLVSLGLTTAQAVSTLKAHVLSWKKRAVNLSGDYVQ